MAPPSRRDRPVFYGHAYDDAALPLALLVFSVPLLAIAGAYGVALIAGHRQAALMRNNVAGAVFNIVANIAVIPVSGIAGAAAVTVASEILNLVLNYRSAVRHGSPLRWPRSWAAAACARSPRTGRAAPKASAARASARAVHAHHKEGLPGGTALLALLFAALLGCGAGGEGGEGRQATRSEPRPFGPTISEAPRPRPGAPIVAALGDSVSAGSPLWDPDPDVRGRMADSLNPQSQYEYWRRRASAPGCAFATAGSSARPPTVGPAAAGLHAGGARSGGAGRHQRRGAGTARPSRRGEPPRDGAQGKGCGARRRARPGASLEQRLASRRAGASRASNARIAAIGREERVPVLPFYAALEESAQGGAHARGP